MTVFTVTAAFSWSDLDWKSITVSLITLVIGGALTATGYWILEVRRKISFTALNVYYGPNLSYNVFMGRNYPSEDRIGLTFEARFFSNKTVATGLHAFQLEFCRRTYMGPIVEFEPDMRFVFKNLERERTPGETATLSTVDLPSRQFVTMDLSTSIGREDWGALRTCTLVRLRCETPEGSMKRFKIGTISFPEMPANGLRGMEYCQILVGPNLPFHKMPSTAVDDRVVILAIRRQKPSAAFQRPPEEDIRYWNGSSWCRSWSDAKVFADMQSARRDGEPIKIWNNVPKEWL